MLNSTQAGSSPCISLPCSSSLMSSLITCLVSTGQAFGEEERQLAILLGIQTQIWKGDLESKVAGCVPDIQATYLFEREEDTSAGQRLHLGIKNEDEKISPLSSREERSNGDSSEKVKVNDYKIHAKSSREERSNRDSSSDKGKITDCKTPVGPQQLNRLPKIKFEPTAKREKGEYLAISPFFSRIQKEKLLNPLFPSQIAKLERTISSLSRVRGQSPNKLMGPFCVKFARKHSRAIRF